jgi:biopolymer transport protein ExbD
VAGRAGHSHRRWRLSNKKAAIDHVRNDINVTPLVDVMLVLLIIFMLMTLVMGRGHDVPLPKVKYFSTEKDKMQPVVSVDVDGNLWIEKDKLGPITLSTLKEMNDRVNAAWAAPKNPESVGRIYLKAENTVAYSKVYPLLEYLNRTMFVQQVDLAVGGDEDK